MRKRNLYRQSENSSSKIPTIIIMCIILFAILYYGKSMSEHVAKVFVPDEPTTDVQVQNSQSTHHEPDAQIEASKGTNKLVGAYIYHTHKSVVNDVLKLLAEPVKQPGSTP